MRDLVWSPAERIPGRMEGDSLAGASSTGTGVKCPGKSVQVEAAMSAASAGPAGTPHVSPAARKT